MCIRFLPTIVATIYRKYLFDGEALEGLVVKEERVEMRGL